MSRSSTASSADRRIRLKGVLDGSSAAELLNELKRRRSEEIAVDFSGIRQFEPFGIEVLVKGLGGPRAKGARIWCLGLPPSLAERLRKEETPWCSPPWAA
jgi:anti-anti-sigma regulatory factor